MSVYGTININLLLRDFSWKLGINHFVKAEALTRIRVSELEVRICLNFLPTRLNQNDHSLDGLAFSVIPSQFVKVQEF